MQTVSTLDLAQAIPSVARVAQADGTWLVYELGDTLPDGIFGPPADTDPVPESVTRYNMPPEMRSESPAGGDCPAGHRNR